MTWKIEKHLNPTQIFPKINSELSPTCQCTEPSKIMGNQRQPSGNKIILICGLRARFGCERVERVFKSPRLKSQIRIILFPDGVSLACGNSEFCFHPLFCFFIHRNKFLIINGWLFYKNHLCSGFRLLNISCSWECRKEVPGMEFVNFSCI